MICEILTDFGFFGLPNLKKKHPSDRHGLCVRHQKRSGKRGAMRGCGTALEAVQDVRDVRDCDGLGSGND